MRRLLSALLIALTFVAQAAHGQDMSLIGVHNVGYVLPVPTYFADIGDSRLGNDESIQRAGSSYQITENDSDGYPTMFRLAIDQAVVRSSSGAYGVGGTTTLNHLDRMTSTSILSDPGGAAPVCTAGTNCNPAGNAQPGGTAKSVDYSWNGFSTGGDAQGHLYGPLSDPANMVVQIGGTNDGGIAGYFTDPSISIGIINSMIANWRGNAKIVFLANETPNGFSTVYNESHACAGCTTVTATNTTQFADGPTHGDPGVIDDSNNAWTQVGTCGAVARTYSVTAGGVYTACTGTFGTSKVYLNYTYFVSTYSAVYNQYKLALSNWLGSSATNFTTAYTTYSGPGALTAGPWVRKLDLWGALVDPATVSTTGGTSTNLALRGALADGLHPSIYGSILGAAAFRTSFLNAYPAYTKSRANSPTANNWKPCNGNASATTFSNSNCAGANVGNLPGAMTGANCPAAANGIEVKIAGLPAAYSNGSGGWTSAGAYTVTAGSYNCGTGAWTITFSAAPANGANIEISEDPTNLLVNGQMETAQGNGTQAANVTGNTPLGWTNGTTGGVTTALTGATLTVTQSETTCTDPDGTFPCQKLVISGTVASAGNITLSNTLAVSAKLVAGTTFRAGGTIFLAPGTNGHTYGVYQTSTQASTNTNSYQPGYPGASATIATLACKSGYGLTNYPYDDAAVNAWVAKFPANMSLGGTALYQRRVTPGCDTTGAGGISNVVFNYTIGLNAGPVSATVYLGRAHLRSNWTN